MLLCIDVGNTNTVLGIFEGAKLVEQWRVDTSHARTSDEWGILARQLLSTSGVDPARVRAIAVSSVVPPLGQALERMAERWFGVKPLFVGPGVKTGMPILYEDPREVGADRVVNAVAAYTRWKTGLVVVDFGTATTFDAVSERGEHLGAAIAPGIEVSMNALVERTAQLRRVELVAPRSVIGKNTVESLQSGAIWGFAGQVDGIVRRMVAELGGQATVVATGGLAGAVLDACESVQRHDPWLTLYGLRIIWDRNRGPGGSGGLKPTPPESRGLKPSPPENRELEAHG